MIDQERVPNTFVPEDGAAIALSMIQFTFINRDKTVCHGELFVGDPYADKLDGAPEHVEWLYRLPEFHDMLEELPDVMEVNADVYHYDLIGEYEKQRGAKASEIARIVDDEFPNNELDLCVSGSEQGIVIYPSIGKPPKPADCPFDRYEPKNVDDRPSLLEEIVTAKAENEQLAGQNERLRAELEAAKSDIAALLRGCECEHRHEYCKGASLEECSGHFPGDCSEAEWRGLEDKNEMSSKEHPHGGGAYAPPRG